MRPTLIALVPLLAAGLASPTPASNPAVAAPESEDAATSATEAPPADDAFAIPGLERGRLQTPRDPTAGDPAPRDPALRPVLDAFGGEAGLVVLMDDFLRRLLADPRTAPFFDHEAADHARIKRQLVAQFCTILGGDCEYTGLDMKTAHAGLGIDRADFNALVEVLQQAMDAHGVPFRAQNRLLARLAPMHRDVVTE